MHYYFLYLAHFLIIGVWIFNIVSMIPQIVLNYRIKSGRGMSDSMLLINYIGFIAGLLYVYAVPLPYVYQLMAPLSCALLIVMMGQRAYYEVQIPFRQRFILPWLITTVWLSMLGVAVYVMPGLTSFVGSLSLGAMITYQFPQLYTVIVQRSTYGFSFSYLTLMTLSATLEMIAAFILGLPLIVKLNGIRALIFYALFCLVWHNQKPRTYN